MRTQKRLEKSFYVYVHRVREGGQIFYVGKGTRNRYIWPYGRSKAWNDAVRENPNWVSQILWDNLDEAEAHQKEIEFISWIGLENLSNATSGGQGVSGLVFTDDQRERLSMSHIGVSAGSKHPLYGKPRPKSVRDKISKSLAGNKNRGTTPLSDASKLKISKSRIGKTAGEKHPQFDPRIRIFNHKDFGKVEMTSFAFRTTYSISQSCCSALVLGKKRFVKGWQYLGLLENP